MTPEGGYYFIVKPKGRSGPGYVAFAKREPFVADAHFAYEPGEMWFEFGATEDEALKNLKRELWN